MIKQTVLPFNLEITKDLITPHAGLALMGEFAVGLGLNKDLDRYLPEPGSGAGYLCITRQIPSIFNNLHKALHCTVKNDKMSIFYFLHILRAYNYRFFCNIL